MNDPGPDGNPPIPVANPIIGEDEIHAVSAVLQSGQLTQGGQVAAFEEEFSENLAHGFHCIAVNSGTSALHLSLLALGIGPGDEVIVPSFSFAATANAVALTGATPIFADIELSSFCLDPDSAAAAVTSRTKAIIPVHLYGQSANLSKLTALCSRYGLAMVEDAAQAHGAKWQGKFVGTYGTAATYSFYPTKNMTSGEGGMVVTRDEGVARQVRLLRNQGQQSRYFNEVIGLNNRMSDLHAAIGRVQLKRLPGWTKRRRANAEVLSDQLDHVTVPFVAFEAEHVFHQYTIRLSDVHRDAFTERLQRRGIGTGVYYPIPIHRLPSFDLELDLPMTEIATSEVVSLPIHPLLSASDLQRIIDVVNDAASPGYRND